MLFQLSVPSILKICGLRWKVFVSSFWGELRVFGSSNFILAKKLNFLKRRLKEWNKEVFGHLDTKLADLVDKISLFDEKEQQLPLL